MNCMTFVIISQPYSIHYLNLSPACMTAEIKTKVHFIMQECTQLHI